MVGENDDLEGFRQPAIELRDALAERTGDPDRAAVELVPRMEHALADEPGIEPASQTAIAPQVDRLAVRWLRHHLTTD